jgi:O-antigen ligase
VIAATFSAHCPAFLRGLFHLAQQRQSRLFGLAFLVLVLSMTWFDLFTGGLVLAVICGIAAVIVWQTRQETGDEAH